MKFVIRRILDFIFPIYCLGCRKQGCHLCSSCIDTIPSCKEQVQEYIFPVFDYRNTLIKQAIWKLKYRNKKEIATDLAQIVYDRLLEELSELEMFENFVSPILIPIPLSNKRLKERGYNQAELIAQEIIKKSTDNSLTLIKNVLYKIKDTKSQMEIRDRKKRLQNLRGAFAVKNPELINGRNIILFDDVTTTGATLNEAKKVLEKAGARKVIGFTVAH